MNVGQRQQLNANIGLDRSFQLTAFAQAVKAAWPDATIGINGSALTSKEWRDIDLHVLLPHEQCKALMPSADTGPAWYLVAAALTALATEMVGARCEVRVTWGWDEYPEPPLDLLSTTPAAASLVDPAPTKVCTDDHGDWECNHCVFCNTGIMYGSRCHDCGRAHYGEPDPGPADTPQPQQQR